MVNELANIKMMDVPTEFDDDDDVVVVSVRVSAPWRTIKCPPPLLVDVFLLPCVPSFSST
jgi:hypothetical protein